MYGKPDKSGHMTGRKNRALQVPPALPYKALENFSKVLYGTMGSTYSARFFRPVMLTDFVNLGMLFLTMWINSC